MDINRNAPIIPCGGAASIILGQVVEIVLQGSQVTFASEQGDLGTRHYRSEYVDFWTDKNDVVYQIMVHDNYAGKVLGKIGLGSTLDDVKNSFGSVVAMDENFVVKGLPGLAFEPTMDDMNSPIFEIYVWQPDWAEIMQHQA